MIVFLESMLLIDIYNLFFKRPYDRSQNKFLWNQV